MGDPVPHQVRVRRFWRSYLGWGLIGLASLILIQVIALVTLYVPNSRERQAAEAIQKVGGAVEFYDPPLWIPKSLYHGLTVLPVYRRIRVVYWGKTVPETLPKELKSLSALQQLYLQSPAFTDEGMKQLEGLTNVKTLELRGTSISDEGLKSLEGIASLRILDLNDTKIGNPGIQSIVKLKELRWISLEGTHVTDESLRPLKDLPFLRRLDLGHTKITDKGLEYLAEIKTLEMLKFSPNQVTDDGVAKLKSARPSCMILGR